MPDSSKRVAILSKPQKAELSSIVPSLLEWLIARGFEPVVDPPTAPHLPQSDGPSQVRIVSREDLRNQALAFAIVLGGDGTLLSAARVLARAQVPIMAVNLGSLGFLTEVRREDLFLALDEWCEGKIKTERRAMARCCVFRDGRCTAQYDALNDIVVARANISRVADLRVSLNGVFVANYMADGVIVATPTGSTAYSLAAGGLVLVPQLRAMIITPVSPHALTNRPLVVPGDSTISITLNRADTLFVTADGQEAEEITIKDEIRCSLADYDLQLIRHENTNFFDVLRSKLKWGER